MPRRYQRQAARRKPNSSPITQFILGFVPVYPGMMHIDQVRKAIQFHSDPRLRLSTASEPASLHARFSTLVKRERLIRTAFGFYARPGQRSDLELHDRWRPKKRMPKPTLSQELRTANAMLREQLGAEPKKRNEKRNLFAPPVAEKPVLSDKFIDMRPEGCLEYPDFAWGNDIFA